MRSRKARSPSPPDERTPDPRPSRASETDRKPAKAGAVNSRGRETAPCALLARGSPHIKCHAHYSGCTASRGRATSSRKQRAWGQAAAAGGPVHTGPGRGQPPRPPPRPQRHGCSCSATDPPALCCGGAGWGCPGAGQSPLGGWSRGRSPASACAQAAVLRLWSGSVGTHPECRLAPVPAIWCWAGRQPRRVRSVWLGTESCRALDGRGDPHSAWGRGCSRRGGAAALRQRRPGHGGPGWGLSQGAGPGGPTTGQDQAAPWGPRGWGALLCWRSERGASRAPAGVPRPLPPPGDGAVRHLQWSNLPSGVLAWPVARDASSLCQRP